MEFKSISLSDFFDRNVEKKLVLPNFQRRYVWDEGKQKRLLASFILNLPIGNLLILKGNPEDYAARDLCFSEEIIPNNDCEYLLDGQQRLSTLKAIFSDLFVDRFNWKDTWDRLPYKLRCRFSIKVKTDLQDEFDLFGFRDLKFDKTSILEMEPTQIEDLLFRDQIQVKDKAKWFHPGYETQNLNLNDSDDRRKVRNSIAKAASNGGLVPLFELYQHHKEQSNEARIHRLVLDRIAANRVLDLKEELSGKDDEVTKLLESKEPNIADILEEINSGDKSYVSQLEAAWMRLSIDWAKDVSDFLESLTENITAQIVLPAKHISRAFAIFEVINQGGTPLNEYDLIVARSARDKKHANLTERITERLKERTKTNPAINAGIKKSIAPKYINLELMGVIEDIEPSKQFKNQFLNLLSIFSHVKYGEEIIEKDKACLPIKVDHIKRKKILELTCDQINESFESTMLALKRALTFLQLRCGIVRLSDLNYQLMILPIAYILKDSKNWAKQEVIDKIEFWYWSSIFSGAYMRNPNNVAISDVSDLYLWIKKNDLKSEKRIKDRFSEILKIKKYNDLETLLHRDLDNLPEKAVHTAILQYVLSQQPRDFLKKEVILSTWAVAEKEQFTLDKKSFDLILNNHHIQPLGSVTKIGETTKAIRDNGHILNSPLNRTLISSASNSTIRDKSPEAYFQYVSELSILGHCIPTPVKTVYKRNEGESEKNYYERVLSSRFEILRRDIINELDQLCS